MIWTTHAQIARLIRKTLKQEFDIELNLKYFIYGNIRPDIQADYHVVNNQQKRVEHFAHLALDYVSQRLYQLMQQSNNHHLQNANAFALELGHITHYFSDFFCYAHTLQFNQTITEHLKYEMRFARYFNRFFSSAKYHNDIVFPQVDGRYQSIISFFHHLQRAYLTGEPSLYRDAYFVTLFTTTLCRSVIVNARLHNLQAQYKGELPCA